MSKREDGRLDEELRPVVITRGFTSHPAGSVVIEFGQTKVLCTASVTEGVPRWRKGSGLGWLTAEYAMLPASTGDRKVRDIAKGKQDGRGVEIQRLIGRSLRGVVDFAALGERTVWIDCDVLQADGGTRTASITGACVALILALRQMKQYGALKNFPIRDYVVATSVGIVRGEPVLDLCYDEDSRADVDMNVVMTGSGKFIELQATAEHSSFDDSQLSSLIGLARGGLEGLVELQRKAAPLR